MVSDLSAKCLNSIFLEQLQHSWLISKLVFTRFWGFDPFCGCFFFRSVENRKVVRLARTRFNNQQCSFLIPEFLVKLSAAGILEMNQRDAESQDLAIIFKQS